LLNRAVSVALSDGPSTSARAAIASKPGVAGKS
jgi:hypothetical protein